MRGISSYHKALFVSLILIAFGVVVRLNAGTSGSILIALGGFFLIVSMARWKKAREERDLDGS